MTDKFETKLQRREHLQEILGMIDTIGLLNIFLSL